MLDTVNALFGELVHAVVFNILFGFEAELLFNLNLNPEALRVKTVLATAIIAVHVFIPDKCILERPAPCVVNTHRVVCGYRTVNELEAFVACVFRLPFVETIVLFPEFENIVFHLDKAVAFLGFSHFFFPPNVNLHPAERRRQSKAAFFAPKRYTYQVIILYKSFKCKKRVK